MSRNVVNFDAASLEIVSSRLYGIAEEMFLTMQRTSYSPIVSAALDYGCALLDGKGGQLVHAAGSMPLFNLALPTVTRDLLAHYRGSIFPGDIFIGNDPWLCCGHIPDVAVVTPVFFRDRLVAFSASVAHQTDFGGAHGHNRVREVYEEGLILPVMKLYERHEPNATLMRIIEANVRTPDLVLGDIHAQVGANEVGATQLTRLLDEYELDDPAPLVEELQSRSERAMRAVISTLPDGTYRSEGLTDSRGHPTRIAVAITVKGDEILVDYEGTGPQLEEGGTNCTLSFTTGNTHYELKAILAPDLPHNEGSTRPIKVVAPQGSILNCSFPASVGARVFSYHETILTAMSSILPDRVMAGPGLFVFPRPSGIASSGKAFDAPMFGGGGQGGSLGRDGMGGYIYPSSASNVSVELFEVACPMMLVEKEWVPDSAGAGQFRGGPAERLTFRRLPDYTAPVRMRYFPIRSKVAAAGMQGGSDGTVDRPLWNGSPVPPDHEIARDGWATFASPSDVLTLFAPSGAGFGPPTQRARSAIGKDIRQGLLTRKGATKQYGHK